MIEPDEVSFGVLLPGDDDSRSVIVRNLGPDPVELSDIYIVGDVDPFDFLSGSCDLGVTLPVNSECDLSLGFSPIATDDFEAALVVEGGLVDEPAVASLTGRSRPPGKLVTTPSSVDFGAVRMGTTSAPQRVQIHNDGGSPIEFETLRANGATMVSNSCGREVKPLETCEVAVTFKPYEFTTWTSEGAMQESELAIRAQAWDQLPPRRLWFKVPMRATALMESGKPYPSKRELASSLRGDLSRMASAAIRLARGGPGRSLELPRFRGGLHGQLRLTIRAFEGKRRFVIAEALTAVDWKASARLRFQLTKRGKRLLRGTKPVRVSAETRFRTTDRSILDALVVTARAKVRPVAKAKKPAKRR